MNLAELQQRIAELDETTEFSFVSPEALLEALKREEIAVASLEPVPLEMRSGGEEFYPSPELLIDPNEKIVRRKR